MYSTIPRLAIVFRGAPTRNPVTLLCASSRMARSFYVARCAASTGSEKLDNPANKVNQRQAMPAERRPTDTCATAYALRKPLRLRFGQIIRNRIMKAPMTEREGTYSPKDLRNHGIPTDNYVRIYEKFGNGGYGIIQTGHIAVEPNHLYSAGSLSISKENDTPKLREQLRRVVDNAKMDGATVLAQLGHLGRATNIAVNKEPRGVTNDKLADNWMGNFGKPVALTEKEVQTEVIDRFIYAARVCHECGFDGVMFNAAFGALLTDFLNGNTNKRNDKYGGSWQKQVRVLLDIYHGIRQELPASFIVGVKLNSADFQGDDHLLTDMVKMCAMMEDRGFDLMEMTGGSYEETAPDDQLRPSTKAREHFYITFSNEIRKVMKDTAIFATGGFRTVQWMSDAITTGFCDGVGLGRPVCAEPDLPKKMLHHGVLSSAFNKLDDNDFGTTNIAGTMQLNHAGKTTLAEVGGDPSGGIPDLSLQANADRFKAGVQAYMKQMGDWMAHGEALRAMQFTDVAKGNVDYKKTRL